MTRQQFVKWDSDLKKSVHDTEANAASKAENTCQGCGANISHLRAHAKWCSSSCAHKAERERGVVPKTSLERHGLSADRYFEILASQNNGCAICHTTDPGYHGVFAVDHDHTCCPTRHSCGNCIRGLLCSRCNAGIGLLGDDPETLMSAAAYLIERSPA